MINVTREDLRLVLQRNINIRIKLDVYDIDGKYLNSIQGGIISGNSSINPESDIRRTFSINVIPNKKSRLIISENGLFWIDKTVRLYIGIYDGRSKSYKWYKQGVYVFTNSSSTYSETTNQLTLNCSDMMATLDGSKNGQLGALTIKFPAYKEDEETGEVLEYNVIRDAVITVLRQLARITDYNVDDIGEYKAMPQYNDDYLKYRETNPLWNTIPYDQEFSCGCSILSILTTFRDLYPNYEMFFDENGTFVCQMIPSCYEDDIIFNNVFLSKILISENTSIDLSSVRNMCEVWGQVIEADFYTEDCTLSNNTYCCNVVEYEDKYYNGDLIAIKISDTNPKDVKLNINGFGNIDVCDENTGLALKENSLEANTVYVFKIKKQRIDKADVIKAFMLGHWQAHGMNVLVDGTDSTETYTTFAGDVVKKYSREYFKDVYNCESVQFSIAPDSPFTVQKIGEILDVKTGGEYENITSDSLALSRAEYENWKTSRLTDSISITTKLCPFADVNIKVSYKRNDEEFVNQYIVKSISHDFSGGTTTWQLMRFYPLYIDDMVNNKFIIHDNIAQYTHDYLSDYTHIELSGGNDELSKGTNDTLSQYTNNYLSDYTHIELSGVDEESLKGANDSLSQYSNRYLADYTHTQLSTLI